MPSEVVVDHEEGTSQDSNRALPETVIAAEAGAACVSGGGEDGDSNHETKDLGSNKVLVAEEVKKSIGGEEEEGAKAKQQQQHCVIDVKCGGEFGENWDEEKVCRICHLGLDQSSVESMETCTGDLIQLGCGCKDGLGIAHTHCAEAWFKLKGNRQGWQRRQVLKALSLKAGLAEVSICGAEEGQILYNRGIHLCFEAVAVYMQTWAIS